MATVTTEADLINLALSRIGHRDYLDDLGEDSTEGETASVVYTTVLQALLARRDWNFASGELVLALTAETRVGWGFCYTFPTDCIVARYIWSGERRPGPGREIPFATTLNDARDGRLVVTDLEEAVLRYTVRLEKVAVFPPHFVVALAAQLAAELGAALKVVSASEIIGLLRIAEIEYTKAAAIDANEEVMDRQADAEAISIRGG